MPFSQTPFIAERRTNYQSGCVEADDAVACPLKRFAPAPDGAGRKFRVGADLRMQALSSPSENQLPEWLCRGRRRDAAGCHACDSWKQASRFEVGSDWRSAGSSSSSERSTIRVASSRPMTHRRRTLQKKSPAIHEAGRDSGAGPSGRAAITPAAWWPSVSASWRKPCPDAMA